MPTSSFDWNAYKKRFVYKAQQQNLTSDDIGLCLAYGQKLYEQQLPIIYSASHFCTLVGYAPQYVMGVANNSTEFYRNFHIAKRNGSRRSISEPLPSLKEIQYWILENILEQLPISPYAKAYRKGYGLRHNARFHRKQDVLVRIDIKNFFPSLQIGLVFNLFRSLGYSESVAALLSQLCCKDNALPQGAPTSPYLSNVLCKDIDTSLATYAKEKEYRYTRYADDLFFSGAVFPSSLLGFVKLVLAKYQLKINYSKVKVYRKENQQRVTGVVVNNKMQVPRTYRKKLRQEVYYIKKNGLYGHMLHKGITQSNYLEHLIGKANHILNVNPKDKEALTTLAFLKEIRHRYVN
ncbi:retron St85 family RNA-directed DNA polymerase [Halodesulfovibrio aestuarii]|uniref:retron St85 family RNA-directed DNA polymerase n=1 Tax=Halodesulfovibrio aestuarii TaxID=126333 RepID=UPI003D32F34D